jgi:hypothetical protein
MSRPRFVVRPPEDAHIAGMRAGRRLHHLGSSRRATASPGTAGASIALLERREAAASASPRAAEGGGRRREHERRAITLEDRRARSH